MAFGFGGAVAGAVTAPVVSSAAASNGGGDTPACGTTSAEYETAPPECTGTGTGA